MSAEKVAEAITSLKDAIVGIAIVFFFGACWGCFK